VIKINIYVLNNEEATVFAAGELKKYIEILSNGKIEVILIY